MRNKSTIARLVNVLLCAACISVMVLAGCSEEVEFTTCDGRNKVTVAEETEGQDLADTLMAQWKRENPNRNWVEEEKERHELKPPADNSALLKGDQAEGHIYGQFTERDLIMWERETEKLVDFLPQDEKVPAEFLDLLAVQFAHPGIIA